MRSPRPSVTPAGGRRRARPPHRAAPAPPRGATARHGRLLGDAGRLAAECRNAAIEQGGELWVESVKLRTRAAAEPDDGTLLPLRTALAARPDAPALPA